MVEPPALVWILGLRPLAPSHHICHYDKGDNKMITEAVHRSRGIALLLRKTSARRPSDEGAVWLVIVSNGVPYLKSHMALYSCTFVSIRFVVILIILFILMDWTSTLIHVHIALKAWKVKQLRPLLVSQEVKGLHVLPLWFITLKSSLMLWLKL